ncbi:YwqH-like family protein [Staphylococcus xylosus]
MTNKAQLMRRGLEYTSLKNTKVSELKGLETDRKRLQEAIKSAKEIRDDFESERKIYNAIEIESNEWSGDTKNKADDKRDTLDEAVKDYDNKYDDVIDQMNSDMEKLETKIEGLETDISELTSRIESLNRQLASD